MKYKLISSATLPGRTQTAEKAPASEKIKFTFFSLLVFAAAIPSTQSVNIVGELFVTEILLPILAITVIFLGKSRIFREKIFWQFTALGFCMMLGYIVSDLVAGTDSSNYLRAWGRNLFLFTSMISLAIIFSSDRRLIWWFVLGLVSGVLVNLFFGHIALSDWKLGYGKELIIFVIAMGYFFPKRMIMFGLIALGVLSIYFDSRVIGATCLITGGIVFIRVKKPSGLRMSPATFFRIILAGVVVWIILINILELTQGEYGDRRNTSNVTRFAALKISVTAISESPILGYGSWGEGTQEFAHQLYKETAAEVSKSQSNYQRGEAFRSHSQLLQTWMEGGLFAAAFFIFYGYQLFIGLKGVVLTREFDYLTPLYSFVLILSFWHLIMSPYSGSHRLQIALAVAVLCTLRLRRTHK